MAPTGTGQRILHLLRDGPHTAQDLAARLDLDVSSVRRHLDGFEEKGWIAFDDRVDGPGRPSRHFHLTDAGWETFPRDYALLLGAVLAKLDARVGRDAILAAYTDVARDLAASVPADQPVATRLQALERLYNGLGFDATVERDGDDVTLVQRNCPFLRTAKDDPEGLCEALDEGIIQQVLPEADVTLGECMATGGTLCRHRIVV